MPHLNHRRGETRRSVKAVAELDGASLDRPRPRKGKPRPWAIQKLDYQPSGEPYGDWWTCRRYSTEKAALDALCCITRNAHVWNRTGQVRSEYRIVSPQEGRG